MLVVLGAHHPSLVSRRGEGEEAAGKGRGRATPLAERGVRPGKTVICCARVHRRRARASRGGGKRGSGERAGAETGREKPKPLDSRFCLFLLERLDSTVGKKTKTLYNTHVF